MRRLFHFLTIFVILFSGCSAFQKKFTIAIDPTFYPANMGAQGDNVYNFMVELTEEIARIENVKINYRQIGSESSLNGLRRKAYDALITPKVNVAIEKDIYELSEPLFLTGPVLIMPFDSKVKRITQLHNKIVGVVMQSDAFYLIQKYPKVFIYNYTSPAYIMEALKYNLIDAALVDRLVGEAFVQNFYSESFKVASKPLSDQGLYLVALKNKRNELIDIYNQGLKKARRRGIYKRLLKKWDLMVEKEKE